MNRKRVILAALLGVLAVCFVYAYVATPRLEKAPPRTASQRVRPDVKPTGNPASNGGTERINFSFLTVEPQPFAGAKRDIFRFEQRRPVRAETPVAIVKAPVSAPVVAVRQVPPPEVVQDALGKFTFLGFLEKAGEKTVFLSSAGRVFLVKRGESFGLNQEFLVADIAGNLLQVRHAGRDELVEIQLVERQKLNASTSSPARMSSDVGVSNRPGARTVSPRQRSIRPAASQDGEESVPEMNEENGPGNEQESEQPAESDVLEGEVNGKNR